MHVTNYTLRCDIPLCATCLILKPLDVRDFYLPNTTFRHEIVRHLVLCTSFCVQVAVPPMWDRQADVLIKGFENPQRNVK